MRGRLGSLVLLGHHVPRLQTCVRVEEFLLCFSSTSSLSVVVSRFRFRYETPLCCVTPLSHCLAITQSIAIVLLEFVFILLLQPLVAVQPGALYKMLLILTTRLTPYDITQQTHQLTQQLTVIPR